MSRLWGHHIICALLIAQYQHHFAREPVKIGHLLWHLAVVMVGYQLLYRFAALGYRAG